MICGRLVTTDDDDGHAPAAARARDRGSEPGQITAIRVTPNLTSQRTAYGASAGRMTYHYSVALAQCWSQAVTVGVRRRVVHGT